MTPLDLARTAVAAARDKKAKRLMLLDVRGQSDICDYQLICSADNERQAVAIADGIDAMCRQMHNMRPSGIEGKGTGQWILLDYGPVLIHVFFDYIRDYYALEKLWSKATPVPLTES